MAALPTSATPFSVECFVMPTINLKTKIRSKDRNSFAVNRCCLECNSCLQYLKFNI